jgi:hypothetical protein
VRLASLWLSWSRGARVPCGNSNALDLAASLDGLNTNQVVYNLVKTFADPYAVPSQVGIAAGTAQTTNTINPSLNVPLNAGSMVTNTIATAAAQTVTNSKVTSHPNAGLTVGFTDSWRQG